MFQPDMVAFVCRVKSLKPVIIRNQSGEAMQQVCLSLIESVDTALAQELHDKRGHRIKAYGVSGLHDPATDVALTGKLNAGTTAWVRLIGMRSDVSSALYEVLVSNRVDTLEIDYQPWQVEAVTWQHDVHPWAGNTTYQALMHAFHDTEKRTDALRLRFVSPTAFSSRGLNLPLPTPRLIFGSLEQQWRALSDSSLPYELNSFMEYFVMIERLRIETRQIVLQGGTQVGFTGEVDITIPHGSSSLKKDAQRFEDARLLHNFLKKNGNREMLARALALLSGFGFYSGVGKKTTQGMGVMTFS